jgi:hypothetical protein
MLQEPLLIGNTRPIGQVEVKIMIHDSVLGTIPR